MEDINNNNNQINGSTRQELEKQLNILLTQRRYTDEIGELYDELGKVCRESNDLLSALYYYSEAWRISYLFSIEYPDSYDPTEYQKLIETIEDELGLHVVEQEGKYGYADKNGTVLIPCIWKSAQPFSEGRAAVEDTENELTGYIDYRGELVIPCEYYGGGNFQKGYAQVNVNVSTSDDEDDWDLVYIFIDWNGDCFCDQEGHAFFVMDHLFKEYVKNILYEDASWREEIE